MRTLILAKQIGSTIVNTESPPSAVMAALKEAQAASTPGQDVSIHSFGTVYTGNKLRR